jgi:hypothetical protein
MLSTDTAESPELVLADEARFRNHRFKYKPLATSSSFRLVRFNSDPKLSDKVIKCTIEEHRLNRQEVPSYCCE